MKSQQNHIINQLILEVDAESEEQSFRVRHQLSTYWQEWLVTYLENAFNELTTSDQVIRIDRLTLDLGDIFYDDFEQQFKEKFIQKLEAELRKQLVNISPKIELLSKGTSELEWFEIFIRTGQLTWWKVGEKKTINEIVQSLFVEKKEELKLVFERILIDKKQVERLIYQVDNQLLIAILTELFKAAKVILLTENKIAQLQESQPIEFISFSQKQAILFEAIIESIRFQRRPMEELEKIITVNILAKTATESESEMPQEVENYWEENNEIQSVINSNKIFTSHAGLILIASFLPQFFENLRLIEDNNFRSKAAKHKAVHLLNYIATGEKSSEEHQLSLEKILCGVKLSEPIPKEIELSENEIDESNELIQSVLTYWKALKNTSMAGFRHSFLLREGILYDESTHWKLRVEKKAYDMLLDVIPWGFAYVKFTWITKTIETEW